jgi:hypothetical protein
MRNLLWKFLSGAVLIMGILILMGPPAQAQDQCLPISGTLYGYATDAWHMVADVTIGRKVYHATILSENTSFFDNGDSWQGTEHWTLDFGGGNTIELNPTFVSDHMTDPVANYTVIEIGTFTKGKGIFKHAFGSLFTLGPFGPNVKLPDNIQAPSGPDVWYFVGPFQGTMCGLNDRDEKRD